ncbi:MAG: Ltp family lipoprotein [Yaniella sp.]|nr:Ltp family lipoprotein [Yaniella sp.]
MSFSRSELIDQLVFEGFSQEQAEYGVHQTGLWCFSPRVEVMRWRSRSCRARSRRSSTSSPARMPLGIRK